MDVAPTDEPYDAQGAAQFLVAVILTYGLSIVFLLGMSLRRKRKWDGDKTVHYWMDQLPVVKVDHEMNVRASRKAEMNRRLSEVGYVDMRAQIEQDEMMQINNDSKRKYFKQSDRKTKYMKHGQQTPEIGSKQHQSKRDVLQEEKQRIKDEDAANGQNDEPPEYEELPIGGRAVMSQLSVSSLPEYHQAVNPICTIDDERSVTGSDDGTNRDRYEMRLMNTGNGTLQQTVVELHSPSGDEKQTAPLESVYK